MDFVNMSFSSEQENTTLFQYGFEKCFNIGFILFLTIIFVWFIFYFYELLLFGTILFINMSNSTLNLRRDKIKQNYITKTNSSTI